MCDCGRLLDRSRVSEVCMTFEISYEMNYFGCLIEEDEEDAKQLGAQDLTFQNLVSRRRFYSTLCLVSLFRPPSLSLLFFSNISCS